MNKNKLLMIGVVLSPLSLQGAVASYGYTNALRTFETYLGATGGDVLYNVVGTNSSVTLDGYVGDGMGGASIAEIGEWTLSFADGLGVSSDDTGRSIEFTNTAGQGRLASIRWTATDPGQVTTAQWVTEVERLGVGGSFWRYNTNLGGESVTSGQNQYTSTGRVNYTNTGITGYAPNAELTTSVGEYHEIILSIAPQAVINFNLDTLISPVPEPSSAALLGLGSFTLLLRRKRS